MKGSIILSLTGLAVGAVLPQTDSKNAPVERQISFRGVEIPVSTSAVEERAIDVISDHFVEMEQSSSSHPIPMNTWDNLQTSHLAKNMKDGWEVTTDGTATAPAVSNMTFVWNTNYMVPVSVGKQNFKLTVSTGLSDTWFIQEGFQCIDNEFGAEINPEICAYGPTFNGTFKYGPVPNTARFSVGYSDGSGVAGQAGYDDVTIAGITAQKQEILLASLSLFAEKGDGTTSGLLGLGYPLETKVFSTENQGDMFPGSSSHQKYDPVFTSMHKQGLISPIFSLAMNRSTQKGYLALGGLPPVDYKPDFARTPIRMVTVDDNAAMSSEASYYTIMPDNFVLGTQNTTSFNYQNPMWQGIFNDTKKNQVPVIVDSGLAYSYLPSEIVLPYVRQFTAPVGRFAKQYWAPCNAVVPKFGITIGGKTLYLDEKDLLQQGVSQTQDYRGTPIKLCLISMTDTYPNGPFVMGGMLLNNFVTAFDVGKAEMRFYSRN